MLVIGDALDAFYLGSFLFGLFFSAVSGFFLGGLGRVGRDGTASHGARGPHLARLAAANPPGMAAAKLLTTSFPVAFVSRFVGPGDRVRNALGSVSPLGLLCGRTRGSLRASAVGRCFSRVVAADYVALAAAVFAPSLLIGCVSSLIRAGGTGQTIGEPGGVRHGSAGRAGDAAARVREALGPITRTGQGIATVGSTLLAPP